MRELIKRILAKCLISNRGLVSLACISTDVLGHLQCFMSSDELDLAFEWVYELSYLS